MASIYHFATVLFLFSFIGPSLSTTGKLAALVQEQPLVLKYHNGALLNGNISVNLIWYGRFTPVQRSIIVDFVNCVNSVSSPVPSAASWWKTTEKYRGGAPTLKVGRQVLHEEYTLGKILKTKHLLALALKVSFAVSSINIVFNTNEVAVDGFCISSCGTHGSSSRGTSRGTYIWVGNSDIQCPGQCAWPFHRPIYGPQTPPLVAPNGDVGVDGMIINLATLFANTVTNPFSDGYFQGPPSAPLEAVSACTGIFGSGSYPGYPGRVRWIRQRKLASMHTVSMDGSTCCLQCGIRRQVHARPFRDSDTWLGCISWLKVSGNIK